MFYKKTGMPEESEIVLCTVTKILYHSVFVTIDEYENLEGMVHISEIAPGRIRNLRDYVIEGRKIVCTVLKIDPVKKHIDLSLRRVNLSQRIAKTKLLKSEEKAYKLLENLAKKLGIDIAKLGEEIREAIKPEFEYLNVFFQKVAEDNDIIKKFRLRKEIGDALLGIINETIKPLKIGIKAEISMQSYNEEGINLIKNALNSGLAVNKESIRIDYLGAPRYLLTITAGDYKTGEEIYEKAMKAIENNFKAAGGDVFSVKRI